ncbi:NC domain-containing-related-like protein [Tripterygium wilfordii]|uniref:NC domain-containing-related-like protein n=1 Tax=Tripterygium wilfordii TaxID=458696 RepID=A0A7J7CUR7_TRIWF|nr:uncharacterized protein LOC120012131 [Tripterygium wilfordii]KAF5737830.1 NC domain-containing-related-like protein [Tripterygium wilfordii]
MSKARDFLNEVGGIFRNHVEIDKNQLVPGQHIYVDRAGGVYTHHGIYVGRDSNKSHVQYVIHFLSTPKNGSSTNSQRCEDCKYGKNANGGVVRTCLNCFMSCPLGGTKLYLYQYDVSLIDKHMGVPGSCSSAPAKPLEEIVKTAYEKLNQAKPREYNLLTYNCETFATECSTGKGESGQVVDNATRMVIPPTSFVGAGIAVGYTVYKTITTAQRWKKK